MAVKKLKIIHKSTTGKTNSEIFNTTLNATLDTDTATAVINWARGFTDLSQDTFEDVEITQTQSLNELIAE